MCSSDLNYNKACGGNGGIGATSCITGSSVYYAGGGGGGTSSCPSLGSPGTGGTGGGGNGGRIGSTNSSNGTANSGGGAGSGGCSIKSGGSGVVIIRVPTASVGTYTGSPTVTTSGSCTIIKFTGSGSYTA